MTENRPEHDEAARDSGPPEQPASDLPLSDVAASAAALPGDAPTIEPSAAESVAATGAARADQRSDAPRLSKASSILLPAISGAIAAALVVAAAWTALGPGFKPPAPTSPQSDRAALDALAARVAGVESRPAASASDPAIGKRIDGLEQAAASLRDQMAVLRGRSEQLAEAVNVLKGAPSQPASAAPADAAPDLPAIKERLAQLENTAKAPAIAPPDDTPLRRAIAATLLDISVRQGEPYAAVLDAARPLAADPAALGPLDRFAAAGVPSVSSLSRDLIALLPKLQPAEETSGSAAGFVDRFQASAERLIRIKRTDAPLGNDRAAIVGRVSIAAQRNDLAEARRELKALAPADLAPVQVWIDKAEARDQALAASRQFAVAALAALPKTTR